MHDIHRRMRSIAGVSLLCLAGALAVPHAVAQQYRWRNIGPVGANIFAIAIDPRTPGLAFAATYVNGILRTTDGGATWNIPGASGGVVTVSIDPSNPSTVYAGGIEGVQKSVDAGVTWVPASYGSATFGGRSVLGIAANSGIVYATTEAGLYKSLDGGATWSPSGSGVSPGLVDRAFIAIDPGSPSTIYSAAVIDDVQVHASGVARSVNGGKSWESIYGGGNPVAMAVTSSAPSRLYVAFDDGRLASSSDTGTTWSTHDLPAKDVSALAIDPVLSSTVYAGTLSGSLHRSDDAGAHWVLVESGMPQLTAIAVDASIPGAVLVGSQRGVYRRADTNGGFAPVQLGVKNLPVGAMAVDPATPSTIYIDVPGGMMKTIDGGTSWADSGLGLARRSLGQLLIDPATPSTLYASAHWPSDPPFLPGVYKSTDAGASWSLASTGLPAMDAPVLAVSPSRPSTLYASGHFNGVWKSIDGAASWQAVYTGLSWDATAIAVDPVDPDTVYLASQAIYTVTPDGPRSQPYDCLGTNVLKSTDGGTHFRQVWITPSTTPCAPLNPVSRFVFDPFATTNIYALGYGTIKSTDRGETWLDVAGDDFGGAVAFAIDPSSPARMYVSSDNGLVATADGGTSWTYLSRGEPRDLFVDRTGTLRAAGGDGLYEYCLSDAPPSTGAFMIDAGITGTWFDPAQPDQVFMLELLPNGQLLAMWFVYAPQGGQAWIFALGSVSGDHATLQASQAGGSGARFPPNLDSTSVQPTAWGTLTFRFSDCNHGHVDWSSTVPGYSSGGMDLTRLTLPAGLQCTQ